jgi:hypothetical protein
MKEKTAKVPYYAIAVQNARAVLFWRGPDDERGFWLERKRIIKLDRDARTITVPLWVAIAKDLEH